MELAHVKDMMVPLTDYATVPQHASLKDAIEALEQAQQRFHRKKYPHRAVLVLDDRHHVVGKVSQFDVLRALEHPYRELTAFESRSARTYLSSSLIQSVVDSYHHFQKPLEDLFPRAAQIIVKDIMYTPQEGEYIDHDASIDEAIYQLASGRHQSLLVTKGDEVVGVLRLSDVFDRICVMLKGNT